MTGAFQIKKQLDGGVQELIEMKAKTVLAVGDPVSVDTDGNLKAFATGEQIFGVNNSQIAAPEFYEQVDIDAIDATHQLTVLINPIKKDRTMIEVEPVTAITTQAAMDALMYDHFDFGTAGDAAKLVNATPVVIASADATVVDFMKYTAKNGDLTFNPIVKMLNATY